jgi:ornithine cyclodeaminase/alanine dehydrogenase-like protein (mu-crystallin family)
MSIGGIGQIVARDGEGRLRTIGPMSTGRSAAAALRWFGAADVTAAMPPLEERIRLAEMAMTALARSGATELPPKVALHPRPEASFVHAMPAHLREADGIDGDLVGMKWVSGFATNTALGLPGISAVIVVNDPRTGIPTAILDGGPITAQRTAAVSGLAIDRFGPASRTGLDVALIGAGVQAHSHLPVIADLLPGATLHVFDVTGNRAIAFAETARSTQGIDRVVVHNTARAAVEPAAVIVSAASFGPREERQTMTNAWLRPDATVIPIDYATYCAAEVAREAALFLVDERGQYLANREAGNFDGYPDPSATIGEAILARTTRPAGRVVISHLGVGLMDLVFADAIVRAAVAMGLGTELPR